MITCEDFGQIVLRHIKSFKYALYKKQLNESTLNINVNHQTYLTYMNASKKMI